MRTPKESLGSVRCTSGWIPVGLLALAAIVGPLRLPVLAVVAAVGIAVLARAGRERPTGPGVAWLAALPVAVSLSIGLLPDPAVTDAEACDDFLAPPVLRRLLQAVPALTVTALLATRLGGRRSLGLVMPTDGRVVALALACPILAPLAIYLGPQLAAPFFGTVVLGLPSAAALVPATIVAITNATLEEIVYRGALQRWGAPALGRSGAMAAQAIVFGSAHLGTDVVAGGLLLWIGLIAAGVVAGLVAARTGLLLPIAAHAAIDIPVALVKTCRFA